MWFLRLLIIVSSLLVGHAANAAKTVPVTLCGEPNDPPYASWRDSPADGGGRIYEGMTVTLMQTLFAKLGRPADIKGATSWMRCLALVETGQVDFAFDAYYDEERAKRFSYSTHYTTLTPQVFFAAARPIDIRGKADLKRYQGCGIIGVSYAHYGLGKDDLELGVDSYDMMVKKLLAGHCDYFVDELEIIHGLRQEGEDYLAMPGLRHALVPDVESPAHYLVTAKNGAAVSMLPAINAALVELIDSGTAAALWAKTGTSLPYKP